jgi:phosphoribosylanthranilate isomerase
MALSTIVKISSVNNLSDARYAAGMGVELLGFNLDESLGEIVTREQFQAITSWVSGVKLVGEIVDTNLPVVDNLMEAYQLDFMQVEVTDPQKVILSTPLPLIIKIQKLQEDFITACMEQYGSLATWFLIEPEETMSYDFLEWCMLKARNYPLIIGSDNISTDNLNEIIGSPIKGIALRGGHEIRPGYKDFDEIADILEALEVED